MPGPAASLNPFTGRFGGPGRHCLLVYPTEALSIPAFAAYLAEGLGLGDKCLYLSEDPVQDRTKLEALDLPPGKIEFRSLADWYLTEDLFAAEKPRRNWLSYVEEALAQGYSGVTAVADVGSFFARRGQMGTFVDYEESIQGVVPGIKLRVICAYSRDALREPHFSRLVACHQVVAYGVSEGELEVYRQNFPEMDAGRLGTAAQFEDLGFTLAPSQGGYFVAPMGDSQEIPISAMARIYRYLFEQATVQTSKALRHQRGVEDVQKVTERVLAVTSAEGLDLATMLGRALKEVVQARNAKGAWVKIFDLDNLGPGLVVEEGLEDRNGCLHALAQKAAQAEAPVCEDDQEVLLGQESERVCLLGIPITTAHSAVARAKGALVMAFRLKPAVEEPWQQEFLLQLGASLGLALERAHLHQEKQVHSLTAAMVIQASADGIMVVNSRQQVEHVNPALERLTGLSREDLMGLGCKYRLGSLLSDGQHTCDTVCPFLQPDTSRGPESVEVSVQTKAGEQRWADMAIGPIYDGSGRLAGVVHTFRDITTRKQTDRLKEDFLALVSHELRSPLTVIMGMASTLLHKEMALLGTAKSGLRDILAQARRLNRLVDNLLVMTLSQAGSLGLSTEYVRVDRLASKVVKGLQGRTQGCSFVLDFPKGFPPALADPVRLELVLRNLVENAIKYSPEGGVIRIWGRQDDSVLTIGVEDHGIGIPNEHLEDVFQSFYRLQDPLVQAKPGVGLGLAVCSRVVEAHGGKIWVESEPGKGSIFALSLPYPGPTKDR